MDKSNTVKKTTNRPYFIFGITLFIKTHSTLYNYNIIIKLVLDYLIPVNISPRPRTFLNSMTP